MGEWGRTVLSDGRDDLRCFLFAEPALGQEDSRQICACLLVGDALRQLKVTADIMKKGRCIDELLVYAGASFQIIDPGDPGHIKKMFQSMLAENPVFF